MKNAEEKSFGGLKTLVVNGDKKGPCIILFHGYGADASDLMPLSEMMDIPNATWIFPDAPMEIIVAPGTFGKAWFNIDQRKLEKAMVQGELLDMSQTTPSGFEGAVRLAQSMYAEVSKVYDRIVVGGFSQGAMLATELALSTKEKLPRGLVILSGTLICGDRWPKAAKTRSDITFFQSHGKNDAILGFPFAENLFEVLSDAGMHGDFMSFGGGHEIPPQVISRAESFIRSAMR